MNKLSFLTLGTLAFLLSIGSASAQSFQNVTKLSDNWLVEPGSGNSRDPSFPGYEYFRGFKNEDTVGSFEVTSWKLNAPVRETFTFKSIDLYSSVTNVPYQFVGTLGSQVVFTASGNVPWAQGTFQTTLNPYSSAVIDKLVVQLTNPASFSDGNPVGFRNIVTVAASVPEPTILGLLGAGLATALLIRRKADVRAQG